MPQRKGPGIVKSGNAGNASKSPSGSKPLANSDSHQDKEKRLFPPGSKYPLSILNERCQKNGWEKPEVIVNHHHEKGYSFVILVRCHNKKTSKLDTVRFEPHPPFYMPTALEARHWGATYALYRICNNIQLNRVLPPGPREYWTQLEQEHKTVPEHQKWMYNPDPFVAKREVETRQMEAASRREAPETANVHKSDSLGGNLIGAIEVKMSSKLRDIVEHAIKQSYLKSSPQIEGKFLSSESHETLRKSLGSLKFTSSQIDRTLKALSSPSPLTQSLLGSLPDELEAAMSHLLLTTPECDLPPRFLAQGAGDSFIQSIHTGNEILKARWINETLIKKAGFPSHVVKELTQSRKSDSISLEDLLLELIQLLAGTSSSEKDINSFDGEERDSLRQSEIMALESVYPSTHVLDSVTGVESSRTAGTTVVIPIPNTPVILHLLLATNHPYPLTNTLPPMYLSDDGFGVPPYIRLHLLSTAVKSPSIQTRESGEGLALVVVSVLEEAWEHLQTAGNPDIGVVMTPFLNYTRNVPDQKSTTTSGSASEKVAATQTVQRKTLKSARDVRTNNHILEEIDKTRLDQNVQSLLSERQKLPAWSARNDFLKLFRANRVVVCVGETGSGKTTQIPQYIFDYYIEAARESRPEALPLGQVQIMITQPRRIAAISVASRVSAERGHDGSVSYSIRGESTSTWRTKLLFCTTGVALRQLTAGEGLKNVSVIIIDEVHERSVDSDFLLLELRDLLERNKNIKIVLMSATINHDVFLNYFKEAALVTIPGRTHPVQDIYLESIIPLISYRKHNSSKPMLKQTEAELRAFRDLYKSHGLNDADIQTLENLTRTGIIDYQLIAVTVSFIVSNKDDGAILIFLPGALEIMQCIAAIKSSLGSSAVVLPLHANLSSDEQKKVFKRYTQRKIIVATNVAETSITIDDVVYVVDGGKAKEVSYDANSRLSRLTEKWISQAAARQRRGRAGRTKPGECYKLYTKKQEENFTEFAVPEILRTPLESLLLTAKATRETEDVKVFLSKAIDPPSTTAMDSAWVVLQELGAIDNSTNNITSLGHLLALLPVDLRLGKMLILGVLFNCLEAILTIAACLSSKSLFVSPMEEREAATRSRNKFMAMNSDLLTDVNAYDECMKVLASGRDAALRTYCENNFISFTSVKDIAALREDLRGALFSAGLLSNMSVLPVAGSPSSLLQSIIMAGLYPGIARVALSSSSIKFDKVQGGTVQRAQEAREFKIFDLDSETDERGQRVFLHPSSAMFDRSDWKQPFICYFRKAVTTKPYLRDATEVPLYAILLFGGPLEVNQVKGWLTIKRGQGGVRISMKAWPRIGVLVNQLRQLLDTQLKEALQKSGKLNVFQKGDLVFDAILALLTEGEFERFS